MASRVPVFMPSGVMAQQIALLISAGAPSSRLWWTADVLLGPPEDQLVLPFEQSQVLHGRSPSLWRLPARSKRSIALRPRSANSSTPPTSTHSTRFSAVSAGSMLLGDTAFCASVRVWLRRFGGNLFTLAPFASSSADVDVFWVSLSFFGAGFRPSRQVGCVSRCSFRRRPSAGLRLARRTRLRASSICARARWIQYRASASRRFTPRGTHNTW